MNDRRTPEPRSKRDWEQEVLAPARAATPERSDVALTSSGRRVAVVYTPEDVCDVEYQRDIADPGTFPFTRGLRHSGYAGRPWTSCQGAGQGTPGEANAHFHRLLISGATGLSVAFDQPTLMGRDPDHARAAAEIGRGGVSLASVADMVELFEGIDPGAVSISMTTSASAPMVFALFLTAAERRGTEWSAVSGALQHDILGDFIAGRPFIYPPGPSMRLATDLLAFCLRETPRWDPISIGGHIPRAGATAREELSLMIGSGIAYVECALAAGLDADAVGARLSFSFHARAGLFEEIARFRAARHVWARLMRERFGARTDRACSMRFRTQTSGISGTPRQPGDDVVCTTFEALAAVLGGTSALYTPAIDEAERGAMTEAPMLPLRTQQVLAYECGLTESVDPFGGSWYLERLTRDVIEETMADLEAVDRSGGMFAAIDTGIPQRASAASTLLRQPFVDGSGHTEPDADERRHSDSRTLPALSTDDGPARERIRQVRAFRETRDPRGLDAALAHLRETAGGSGNLMDALLVCARADATLGEMCDVLRNVWGEHVERVSS